MSEHQFHAPAFHDIKDYPALNHLVEHWQDIRDEFLALDAPIMDIHRYGKGFSDVFKEVHQKVAQGERYGWLSGWNHEGPNLDWCQYGLMAYDRLVPFVDSQTMAKTMALLKPFKGVKVAALLTLKANSFITGHRHPEIEREGLLQFHLTLNTASTDNAAYLNVAGEFAQNIEGKPVVFNGSNHHFAVNASAQDRTILYIEFKQQRFYQPQAHTEKV